MTDLLDVPLTELRRRRSAKWTAYADDVLPLPVAEMDVRLAAPIAAELRRAIADSDTGYAGDTGRLRDAFATFAAERWRWETSGVTVRTCADVATGATELLRLLAPGEQVVVTPPVYAPFYKWVDAAGAQCVEVPLVADRGHYQLDVPGIGQAFEAGARVLLLCHPHNPTGHVTPPSVLRRVAEVAAEHGAIVISDEIHAPLTAPGTSFTPFLSVSETAAAVGLALHSPSKAWNLAGLKCALIVAADPARLPADLPHELPWGVGHLGLRAAEAAYGEGGPWLDELLGALQHRARLLETLVAEHLPSVRFRRPDAGYVAWLDLTESGLAEPPAALFLRAAKVAVSDGGAFGAGGAGHVRLNFACSAEVLAQAVTRMAAALAADASSTPRDRLSRGRDGRAS